MFKKLLPTLTFMLFASSLLAQTIVGTSPENKNVILEEYTGIHCVWCPEGHAVAQGILNNNPDDVFLINIHVGGYAVPNTGEPDFRTPFGTAIAAEAGVPGYPTASINRHVFSGGVSAMSRSLWPSKANETMAQGSYVNVGVEADIDVQTNEMTVHVEAFYTGNSPESSNLLNVALLQNNTKGPQTGGDMGNQYNHMHRLVYLITGQWGVSISPTTTGTFIDETYTYSIPADYNGVPVELADLELVAFISETHQEVPTGNGCIPTYSNFANANDARVRYIEEIADQCGFDIAPRVNIQNVGNDPITSLQIDYSVNGGATESYNWTGSLTSLQDETIELPEISYAIDGVNTVDVSIQNDDDNSNNSASNTFDNAIEATSTVYLILNTDNAGSQTTWTVTNHAGDVVYSGGPYDNNLNIQETLTLPIECYDFEIMDSGGNGSGSFVLFDLDNNVILNSNGDYGSGISAYFSTNGTLGNTDSVLENISIYPNPTHSVLNIKNAENSNIEIYDLLGRLILSKSNISIHEQIQVSNFNAGTYLIRFVNDNKVVTDKFIVNK